MFFALDHGTQLGWLIDKLIATLFRLNLWTDQHDRFPGTY